MSRLVACLALLGGVTGCSLTVAEADPCQTNAECREAFGVGSVCSDAGYCAASTPPARCENTVPDDFFDNSSKYASSTLIGALFSESDHLDSIQASRLAILEANAADGIEDGDFVMVYCDYGTGFGDDLDSEEASEEGARYLTETLGASAIVGPRGSGRSIAAFESLGETDAIVISPSATSPELTTIDEPNPSDQSPGRLWRTVPPDGLQAEVIVADMVSRGVTSVAIIAQQGAYGDALAGLVDAGFVEASGGTVSVFSYADSPFGAVADAAAAGADEAVFISSDIGDYVSFFTAAVSTDDQEMAFDAMGIFLTDGAFNLSLLEPMDPAVTVLFDNVRGTRPAPAIGPLFNAFAGAFADEYGTDPESSGFIAHTYDATWLVLYAHAWAHFNEDNSGGRSLGRGLRKLSAGDPVSIRADSWSTVLAKFEAGESINVAGASGELDYDPDTEETSAPIQIWGIADDGMGGHEFVDIELVDP